MGGTYIGTEHVLLALLREGEGLTVRILVSLEVDTGVLRQDLMVELRYDAGSRSLTRRSMDPMVTGERLKSRTRGRWSSSTAT
jgi:ATP-dependent Clp protease ATP-binding subunit ClpA